MIEPKERGTARPEVLAPGGSLASMLAAALNRADAVYFGIGSLNARQRAANIEEAQLPGLVSWLHSQGVKAYVTLNIPVEDDRIPEACRLLAACHLAGVDAVILRDERLMILCRDHLPDLELHASTQYGVLGPGKAERARSLGCRRVILGREVGLEEIRRIKRRVPELELECFVFGAMCFGVSGHCLLGEAVGGRSGNYGACNQACRLEYFDAQGRNLGRIFSMKDLDLVSRVPELQAAGVSSFKIEGRLKPPAYVGCVSQWVARSLDSPRGLTPEQLARFDLEVSALFSRPRDQGFISGAGEAGRLITPGVSGHLGAGVEAFRVLRKQGRTWLELCSPLELSVRDGLTLIVPGRRDPVSIPVSELVDDQGRGVGWVPEGTWCSVPLDGIGEVSRVFIHSCARLRQVYQRGSEDQLLSEIGHSSSPLVTRVSLESGLMKLAGLRGRLAFEADYPVDTVPATGRGFDQETGERYFGPCRVRTSGAWFVRPSQVKQVRRLFGEAFREAAEQRLESLTQELLRAFSGPGPTPDQELIKQVPACISRVTGIKAGLVAPLKGRYLRIIPSPRGTRVEVASPEDSDC